jgi:1-deoxy-D-xylulose 5-phosphate reductoisomerase
MLKYIQQIDRNMAKAFLAMFMVSGDNGVGSNAKVSSEMDFFILTVKGFAETVLDEVNKAIKELIDLNFTVTDKEDYPRLEVTDLETVDSKAFAETIKILADMSAINPNEEKMNEFIRNNLNLPEISELNEQALNEKEEEKKREKAMTDFTIHGNKKLYMKEVGKNPDEVIDTLS